MRGEREMSKHTETEYNNKRAIMYLRANPSAIGKPHRGAAATVIERQREICLATANTYGLTVVGEYCDMGGAAAIEPRFALRQLLEEFEAQRIGWVIVSDLARFSR